MNTNKTNAKINISKSILVCAILGWFWGLGVAIWTLAYNNFLSDIWPAWAIVIGVGAGSGTFAAAFFGLVIGAALWMVTNKSVVNYIVASFIAGIAGWIVYLPSVNKDLALWEQIVLRIVMLPAAALTFIAVIKLFKSLSADRRFPWKPLVLIWAVIAIATEIPISARWITFSLVEKKLKANPKEEKVAAIPPKFTPLKQMPPRDGNDRAKVLVLAIDALSMQKLDQLIAQGRLPNFARLKAESAWGYLQTMEPVYSPRIWTTVATGKAPETHGIEDFALTYYPFLKINERLNIPSQVAFLKTLMKPFAEQVRMPEISTRRKVKALWNIVGDAGMKVGVMGWWASWPPEEINGFTISDHVYFDIPGNISKVGSDNTPVFRIDLTWPHELYKEIERFYLPQDKATPEMMKRFMNFTDDDRANFMGMLRKRDEKRYLNPSWTIAEGVLRDRFYWESALYLMQTKGQPDLMMVYLRGADIISHATWLYSVPEARDRGRDPKLIEKYKNSVDAIYIFQDEYLGKFMAAMELDTTLIVLSDHGFGPDKKDPTGYGHYHPYPGVIFVMGPNVRKGFVMQGASVEDAAVNILSLLGLPMAVDMIGKPWREIMTDSWQQRHPPRKIKTYEAGVKPGFAGGTAEDKELIERLKALGYLQ